MNKDERAHIERWKVLNERLTAELNALKDGHGVDIYIDDCKRAEAERDALAAENVRLAERVKVLERNIQRMSMAESIETVRAIAEFAALSAPATQSEGK